MSISTSLNDFADTIGSSSLPIFLNDSSTAPVTLVFATPIAKRLGSLVEQWIDDGLMTFCFLLVDLELEREVYLGELPTFRKAILPVVAAIGGMVVPASFHLSLNFGTAYQRGAGIPTATDIAFSLALLSIVAKRVPFELKMFLAAVPIANDLSIIAWAFLTAPRSSRQRPHPSGILSHMN